MPLWIWILIAVVVVALLALFVMEYPALRRYMRINGM